MKLIGPMEMKGAKLSKVYTPRIDYKPARKKQGPKFHKPKKK